MSEPVPVPPRPLGLARQTTRSGFDDEVPGDLDSRIEAFPVAQSLPRPPSRFQVKVGGVTDAGGSKENQDDYFTWHNEDQSVIAVGVLDGHGRELGQRASRIGARAMRDALAEGSVIARIRENAQAGFQALFDIAHSAIREDFLRYYTGKGYVAEMNRSGFMVVRDPHTHNWVCVHGGTTATVTLLVDGTRLYTANVGDSTAILAGWKATVLSARAFDAAAPAQEPVSMVQVQGGAGWGGVHLSVDHSPEEPSEYERIRGLRPSPEDSSRPELLFVYDALVARPKNSCAPIFRREPSGELRVTNDGQYYKNVRSEWASLVTTPAHAEFQDALAFTRSIGDFHLQTYGVRCEPDVRCVDLDAACGGAATPACVIVASDGVWDNWTYEDTVRQLETYVPGVEQSPDASNAAVNFMKLNYDRGIANFGRHADNMTAVLMYIFPVQT